MKVTLQLSCGREMTFSEKELVAIVENHLQSESTQKITTTKVVQKLTEDVWFEVKPQTIDQELFEKKREDSKQEVTRRLILEAFDEMNYNPEKYGRNFKTMMPRKTWTSKTVAQLKKMASELGDHNADWVEQALQWAQRIANGESWRDICNAKDTANYYRLVVWRDRYARLVGGSVMNNNGSSASDVTLSSYDDNYNLRQTVPFVVSYD